MIEKVSLQAASAPAITVESRRIDYAGASAVVARQVPVETPINIVYGTIPFAVMMATPADIEDFVVGFSRTEGIIETASDIRSIVVEPQANGVRVLVTLAPHRMSEHLSRKRSLSGRTGCGVCGVEDLSALPGAAPVQLQARLVGIGAIEKAMLDLEHHQPLNDATRAVHGAAWYDADGSFIALREDVGRHNALDKLIGALLRDGVSPQRGFAVITSRCSFEMVEKLAAFGGDLLVAISAPTSLAIERATSLGITLVAIARHDSAMVFCGSLSEVACAPDGAAQQKESA